MVELLGAASIAFYGVWLIAVPNNGDITCRPHDAPLRRRYHVRVLIPCYNEPLAIVRRTALAARRADVPAGCQVTVYLCDDGRQDDKRRFAPEHKANLNQYQPSTAYQAG